MTGRLIKSNRNRMIFGVAGGLAEYFRVDPVIIRVLFILLTFASGIGVLLYLALALIMPRPEAATTEPLGVVKDNLRAAPHETSEAGRRVVAVLRGSPETRKPDVSEPPKRDGEGTTVE